MNEQFDDPFPQIPLFDGTDAYARRTDPITSHEAAAAIALTDMEAAVLNALRQYGEEGATCPEIADDLGVGRDSVSPRMKPLLKKGLIYNTGRFKVGKSGRRLIVWAATKGLEGN